MDLVADQIAVARGEDVIFTDLTFTASSGQALVISGPNGSGKSTLIRAVAGLLPLTNGALTVDNKTAEFGDRTIAELCHFLGHENAMKAAFSVRENLKFWQQFCGDPHLDVEEALDFVGLAGLGSLPYPHLSTGQRRRAAIARLLVSYRPIWLLDEPTSGLDSASEEQFTKLMNAHLDDDGLILVATHVPLALDNARSLDLGRIS